MQNRLWIKSSLKDFSNLPQEPRALGFSADGKHLWAAGFNFGTIVFWNSVNGDETGRIETSLDKDNADYHIVSAALSPDGMRMAVGTSSAANLWDVPKSKRMIMLENGEADSVPYLGTPTIVFGVDGKLIVTGSEVEAGVWNANTGKKLQRYPTDPEKYCAVYAVAFDSKSQHVLMGLLDGSILLWDVAARKKLGTFKGHSQCISTVVFSSDGHLALSSSRDQSVVLWDLVKGAKAQTFK